MKQLINQQQFEDNFTLVEKLKVLYCGLHVARNVFFVVTENALLNNWISVKEKNDWEHFFHHEYLFCRNINFQTYSGMAWLEFKVRHLMDLALNISFDRNPAWKGYSISFENIFFPFLNVTDSANN